MKQLLLSITLLMASGSTLLASNSFQNSRDYRGASYGQQFVNQNPSVQQVNHTPMRYQRVQRVERRVVYRQPQFQGRVEPIRVAPRVERRVQPRMQPRVQPQVQVRPRVQQQLQRQPLSNRFEPRRVNRVNPQLAMKQKSRFLQAQEAAKRGNPQAEFDLAMMYAKGEGVQKDPRVAFNLFHRAARKGHVDAKYCMGVNFDKGFGVIQQKELARHWYGIASKAGHRGATQRLAQLNNQHSRQRLVMNASYRRR